MKQDLKELRKELDKMLKEGTEDIYLNFVRPIKRDMYLCSSKCCDQNTDDGEYEKCLCGCLVKNSAASYLCKASFTDFKRRLQNCLNKCETGEGFDMEADDDEGDDGEVTAEELQETSFPGPSDPDMLLDDIFKDYENVDLEHEPVEDPSKPDFKDCDTCSRCCLNIYKEMLVNALEDMKRDLSATYLSKHELQGYYYDWSRAITAYPY